MAKLNEDTDRTQAIVVKHVSHRWLKELDRLFEIAKSSNGGFFNLFATFVGTDQPSETDINLKFKPIKLHD